MVTKLQGKQVLITGIRGGETRAKMIALNREDPAALDKRFLDIKPALAEAAREHSGNNSHPRRLVMAMTNNAKGVL